MARNSHHVARGERKKITPPQLADRYGISPDKVLVWIRSGELRAIDASTKRGGRPRFLIDESDIEDFEKRRAVVPAVRTRPARPRERDESIIEFYK